MQSDEKNVSSTPSNVLLISQLPPLLANWNTLKSHFLQYGHVQSVVLNPQRRCATVRFETVEDAEYAKSKGSTWRNKDLRIEYCKDPDVLFDPRAKADQVLGYSDLDTLWNDDYVEEFGVVESKSPVREPLLGESKKETRKSTRLSSKEVIDKAKSRELRIVKPASDKKGPKSPKVKSVGEKKSPVLKSSIEKKARSLMTQYSVKQKQKEVKKKIKEALLEIGKKRRSISSREPKDVDMVDIKTSDPALSLKDKFKLLDERDKRIRKSLIKVSDVKTAKAIVGTCPDMCPEKERIMREYRRLVSVYEMIPGTQKMDHSIAVKAYVRSSADQEEPLAHELRPAPVLSMTMSYLITKIMPLINDPEVNISDWYDFCWDRLRGIRKDVIQQRLCSLETVLIIEQCARFHICCYDYFWGADPSVFDEKINTENLMNCLQTLRHMYEDLSEEGVQSPNEIEFKVYMILLNMKTGDLMATYQLFSENLQKDKRIKNVVKLHLAFNNGMYSQFFKLVKNSTYLDACLLQRYFYHVRVQALQAIARAYCPPNKSGTIPVKQMKNILKFDNAEDTILFCEGHGIMLKETGRDFSLYRNDFFIPDTKVTPTCSSSLVTDKRLPLVDAVTGSQQYNLSSFKDHKIHSSFNDNKLNEMVSTALVDKREQSETLPKPFDVEMIEDSDTVEDQPDAQTMEYFDTFTSERFNKAETEVETSTGMDTDENEIIELEKTCPEKEISNTSVNNEPMVSRKRSSDSSAFRFDLSAAKVGTAEKSVGKPSTQFQSGLVTTNIFGTKNQLVSDQLTQNQFSLKMDFTKQFSKDSLLIIEQKDQHTKQADALKSPIKTFENFRFKSDNIAAGKGDLFLPSQVDGFQSKRTSVDDDIVAVDSSTKGTNSTETREFKHLENYTELSTKETQDYQINKENEPFIQPISIVRSDSKIASGSKRKRSSDGDCSNLEDNMAAEKAKFNEIKTRLREKELLNQLRKDLRNRLKIVTARHFIRKWKQKIERLKANRKEFPLLIGTPLEEFETIWGTHGNVQLVTTQTLLKRLREKRQNFSSIDLILKKGLQNIVDYVGNEIAENVVLNNVLRLEFRDFVVPIFWKLVVSIPFPENSFFAKKFYDWLNKLFYRSAEIPLGSVAEETTSQNVSVYYCVHLVAGMDFHNQKDKLNGMNGLIFFSVSGIENSVDECRRFRNLISTNKSTKPVTVALVNIGKEDCSDAQLVNVVKDKVKLNQLNNWTQKCFKDFNCIHQVLKFLTTNVDLSNDIRVSTLYSLFNRVSEHLVSVLDSIKSLSEKYSSALLNPNFVIDFYNSFFSELEGLIVNNELGIHDVVPPEFKGLVHFSKTFGKESTVEVSLNKSRRPNIMRAFTRFQLPRVKPWPPGNAIELLDTLTTYCYAIGCNSLLPRLVRLIDLNDDVTFSDNLSNVSWIDVVHLIVRWAIETHSEDNNKIVVIYNERDISNMCQLNVNCRLLHSCLEN